jgi:hypothetical protein
MEREMMKKYTIIVLTAVLALMATGTAFAESESGGYAGSFLNYDLSAMALGMGGAFTAVAEGSAGIRYNPAGISGAEVTQAGFTYSKLTWDRRLNYAEIIFPLPKKAVIGLSWINAGVSDVKERDYTGAVVGDLENNQNSFNVTFGRRLIQQLALGVNVRYVQYDLSDVMASTMGIDFGAMGYFLDDDLTVGAKLGNIGSKYAWDTGDYYELSGTTYDEEFPTIFRFGAAYRFLEKSITVAADYEQDTKRDAEFRIGAEYWHFKDYVEVYEDEYTGEQLTKSVRRKFISARVGYNDGRFTFGAGIRHVVGKIFLRLDYGFATGALDGLSPDHLISLGVGLL